MNAKEKVVDFLFGSLLEDLEESDIKIGRSQAKWYLFFFFLLVAMSFLFGLTQG